MNFYKIEPLKSSHPKEETHSIFVNEKLKMLLSESQSKLGSGGKAKSFMSPAITANKGKEISYVSARTGNKVSLKYRITICSQSPELQKTPSKKSLKNIRVKSKSELTTPHTTARRGSKSSTKQRQKKEVLLDKVLRVTKYSFQAATKPPRTKFKRSATSIRERSIDPVQFRASLGSSISFNRQPTTNRYYGCKKKSIIENRATLKRYRTVDNIRPKTAYKVHLNLVKPMPIRDRRSLLS